jgi:hypothetical protein
MKNLPLIRLVENPLTQTLYPIDNSIDRLCMSVELFGILENIIVYKMDNSETPMYQIISGNRRKKAAELVGLNEVPCTIVEPVEITEALVRSHHGHRTIEPSIILKELILLKDHYGLRQGAKNKTPQMVKAKQYKDAIISMVGTHTIKRLASIHKIGKELSGSNEEQYSSIMRKLDKSGNIYGTLKGLQKELKEKQNRKTNVGHEIVRLGNFIIYANTSELITELENESVQTMIYCPQYVPMRYVHVSIVNSKSNYGETSLITIIFEDVSRFISKIDSINNAVGYQSFEISVEPDNFLFEDAEIEELMGNNIFVM